MAVFLPPIAPCFEMLTMSRQLLRPFILSALVSAVVAWVPPVAAEIFKCTDAQGNITYSNMKIRNCKSLGGDYPRSSGGGSAASSASPASAAGFPRVDPGQQKARDDDRRRILEQELATEQKALDQARRELSEQEAIRNGDERNYQKVLDRLQPFKDRVALHERNIEAIKKEMSHLR
jgi:hypothetical protein